MRHVLQGRGEMTKVYQPGDRVRFTQEHKANLAKAGLFNPLKGDDSTGTVERWLSGAVYVIRLDTGHVRDVHAFNLEAAETDKTN